MHGWFGKTQNNWYNKFVVFVEEGNRHVARWANPETNELGLSKC
jgi:hypothetical protein